MESHGRLRKVKEGQGRSWMVFSLHWIDITGEKSYGWGGEVVGWWRACRIILDLELIGSSLGFEGEWRIDLGWAVLERS